MGEGHGGTAAMIAFCAACGSTGPVVASGESRRAVLFSSLLFDLMLSGTQWHASVFRKRGAGNGFHGADCSGDAAYWNASQWQQLIDPLLAGTLRDDTL